MRAAILLLACTSALACSRSSGSATATADANAVTTPTSQATVSTLPIPTGGASGSASNPTPLRAGCRLPNRPYKNAPAEPAPTGEIAVEARSMGTNAGLSLERGDTVTLTAKGTWKEGPQATPLGPGGFPNAPQGGCNRGSLVATIGLPYQGGTKFCVGAQKTITADAAGILYLMFNGSHEERSGTMTVTVQSAAARAHHVHAGNIATFDFKGPKVGTWIEITGDHVTLVLPTAYVAANRDDAPRTLNVLDTFYESHHKFVGEVPFSGEKVRFFPDESISKVAAHALSGNPIRFRPNMMEGNEIDGVVNRNDHWLHLCRPDVANHQNGKEADYLLGGSHELGHDFTLYLHGGGYMVGPGMMEAWANIPSMVAQASIGTFKGNLDDALVATCKGLPKFLQSGRYEDVRDDAALAFCMLLEIAKRHGLESYGRFLRAFNATEYTSAPATTASDGVRWRWVRDRLNHHTNGDVTDILTKFRIPLQ